MADDEETVTPPDDSQSARCESCGTTGPHSLAQCQFNQAYNEYQATGGGRQPKFGPGSPPLEW